MDLSITDIGLIASAFFASSSSVAIAALIVVSPFSPRARTAFMYARSSRRDAGRFVWKALVVAIVIDTREMTATARDFSVMANRLTSGHQIHGDYTGQPRGDGAALTASIDVIRDVSAAVTPLQVTG